jgi:TolB-like protein/class 3 adenylate cyclase/Tfp pilus assembly protein PilF
MHMERRLAAILSADVVGYARLMGADEAQTLAALRGHRTDLLDPKTALHRGRVIKLMGDGVLMEFPSVVDAVLFAVDVQYAMRARNTDIPADQQIVFRVGINLGDIIAEGDDIHGDGVNLAARIEGLADPGGICVSRPVRDQVRDKLALDFEDMGEIEVKNIARPVRAFRVVMNDTAAALAAAAAAAAEKSGIRKTRTRGSLVTFGAIAALALAGVLAWFQFNPVGDETITRALVERETESSIVVLPLDNLSNDPAQEYFADGLTEDLTTDLSQLPDLFVISRNTAFSYKDRTINPKQISQELGVRYVLEGSVRRVGNLLRINVQLIDGETGGHVWAQRYDGSADDVLRFQDNVMEEIVAFLPLHLDPERQQRSRQAETQNPKAFDAFLQGWDRFIRRTPEDYAAAAGYFKRAIDLDPDYGRAYAALAATYWEGWERWWFKQLGFDTWMGPRREAEKYLEIALQRPTALAHQVASEVRRQERRHDEMLREARTAVRLDPNDPNSYIALAWAMTINGEHMEALAAVDRALSLDPHFPAFYIYLRGVVLFSLERYEEAIELLERALERNPANFSANNLLIASYAQLGNMDKARERLEWHPIPMSIDWMEYYYVYKNSEDWDRVANALRMAGAPEIATKVPTPAELSGE